jgi:hypothetical protein
VHQEQKGPQEGSNHTPSPKSSSTSQIYDLKKFIAELTRRLSSQVTFTSIFEILVIEQD